MIVSVVSHDIPPAAVVCGSCGGGCGAGAKHRPGQLSTARDRSIRGWVPCQLRTNGVHGYLGSELPRLPSK